MTTMASLDEIRKELDVELRAQIRRAESAGTRSCVLLAASGAVAGLAAAARTPFALPGAAVALAAAMTAAGAFRPARHHVFDPINMSRLYVTEAPDVTRQAVLDRRASDFERYETALDHQVRRLRVATDTLLAAVALLVAGAGVPTLLTYLDK